MTDTQSQANLDVDLGEGAKIQTMEAPTADIILTMDTLDSTKFGNKWEGLTMTEGPIAGFESAGTDDIVLTFRAWDMDYANEIEVFVNGTSLGVLPGGSNNAFSDHEFLIDSDLLVAGSNFVEFRFIGQPAWVWGVTDFMISPAPGFVPGPADVTLDVGVLDASKFGNKWEGRVEDDGPLVSFDGTGSDMILTFKAWDMDYDNEIEVFVNGESRGVLPGGFNNSYSSHELLITADEQIAGENQVEFRFIGQASWVWGVTDFQIDFAPEPGTADMALELGVLDASKFGNKWEGLTDTEGALATFTGTESDLLLTFTSWDMDNANEVEVFVNGVSRGVLDGGYNDAYQSHEFLIAAEDQLAGENTIEFRYIGQPAWVWGISDFMIDTAPVAEPADVTLELGVLDSTMFGNKWEGLTDSEGPTLAFEGTEGDVILTFKAWDMDYNNEIEVFVNGVSRGVLPGGSNNAFSEHEFLISAEDQLVGTNEVELRFIGNASWVWGVTDFMVDTAPDPTAPIALTPGVMDETTFGNKWNGNTDTEGRTATFEGTEGDLLLTFKAWDMDAPNEIEVFVNGASRGILPGGFNNQFSEHEILISAEDQLVGENTIEFRYIGNASWVWGIQDIMIDTPPEPMAPDMSLTLGTLETGNYGNGFEGTTNDTGVLLAHFEATGSELVLQFTAWDLDSAGEVEVWLNGSLVAELPQGTNNGSTSLQYVLGAEAMIEGTNSLEFRQTGPVTNYWGVTDVLVFEPAPEGTVMLTDGVMDEGVYGNGFEGNYDADGVLTATFEASGHDMRFSFRGYDIDNGSEIEVFLNGVSYGFIAEGVSDGWANYEILFDAADVLAGENTISIVNTNPNFFWGVDSLEVDEAPAEFTPTDDRFAEQWQLQNLGSIEQVWAKYTGAGVNVGIYDDGLQHSHYELDGNYVAGLEFNDGFASYDPEAGGAAHGTAVAGIIVGEADGAGTVGIAFDASYSGVNIIDGPLAGETDIALYEAAMKHSEVFDVVNHSWGASPGFDTGYAAPGGLFDVTISSFEYSAINGRGGYGTVHVKSSGNDAALSSGDLIDASRFSITVGAVGETGVVSPYSNYGSNLFVTAPSSGGLFDPGVLTTDLLGADGVTEGDYTGTDSVSGFGGTSAAAPAVTGVIALMLEANEFLGWRDVQEILALSSTHNDGAAEVPWWMSNSIDLTDANWVENAGDNWNGGGLFHSASFGFGQVNAAAAVRMAEAWSLFDTMQASHNEESTSVSGTPGVTVGLSTVIALDLSAASMDVEHVDVSLDLTDSSVDVFLTSAAGTRVQLLASGEAPAGALAWSFGAETFRGEDITGEWSLEIVDADESGAILNGYTVDFFGAVSDDNDIYTYTDEMLADFIYDAETDTYSAPIDDFDRVTVADASGVDWLNMAAMTSDLSVDMAYGVGIGETMIAAFDFGTVIENVVTGIGDDIILGNDTSNDIHAQDGDDTIGGGLGDDFLFGGEGDDVFAFELGWGHDTVEDFDVTADLLVLGGFGELTFGDLVFDDTSGDLVLDMGSGDMVTFWGLTLGDITADHVDFYDPYVATV